MNKYEPIHRKKFIMTPRKPPTLTNAIDTLVAEFVSRRPLRSRSLLVTFFGDFVEPHGGSIWLGSMAKLVEPLGINERLVRTSVFRLQQDDWLQSTQKGRRSHYQLTPYGKSETDTAESLIYDGRVAPWDRNWCLVFGSTPQMTAADKLSLKEMLRPMNFGTIAPNVYGHPNIDSARLKETFFDSGLADKLVVMYGTRSFDDIGINREDMALFCCNYVEIELSYESFCKVFGDASEALERGDTASNDRLFLLRLLLIHEFRRIVLKDPRLPAELLPDEWAGDAARRLARNIYRTIHDDAARHFVQICEQDGEPVAPMSENYHDRFTWVC